MKLLAPSLEERRMRAYLAGADYRFYPPPVCTAYWTAESWSKYVEFTEPDRYGSLDRRQALACVPGANVRARV